jgi:hypothetical protein
MIRLLLFAVIITIIVIAIARFKKMNTEQQRNNLWRIGSGIFVGVLVLLVLTGRMHWVGAVFGALLPLARGALGLLPQLLPYWRNRQQKTDTKPFDSQMSIKEAQEILGLKDNQITKESIEDAHRHLMQKLHPDRGGNDYLAAKINHARDLLLNTLDN